MEGLLLLKNTFEPEWSRSWILSRSLGVGKVGLGRGRVGVESAAVSGEEGRMGMGLGEGLGFEGAGDIARGVGRGLGD